MILTNKMLTVSWYAYYFPDVSRYYGSTRSLTQDLGSLSSLINAGDSTTSISKDTEDSTPKFSSYLAMRTKSPARPPLSKSNSFQGVPSTTSSYTSKLEEISEKPDASTLSRLKSAKTDSLSSTGVSSSKTSGIEGKPPKGHSRILKDRTSTLSDLKESSATSSSDPSKPDRKKIIQSLRVRYHIKLQIFFTSSKIIRLHPLYCKSITKHYLSFLFSWIDIGCVL